MEFSSDPLGPVVGRRAGGGGSVPVVGYPRRQGTPPISVAHWQPGPAGSGIPTHGPHAHDFLVLLYVESGAGTIRVDEHRWPLTTGDVFVIAPGAVVTPGPAEAAAATHAWAVLFPSDAVDPGSADPLVSWRTHPLLFPFTARRATGGQPLRVPPAERPEWSRLLSELHDELGARRDGYPEAATALLTLLLVRLTRLGPDVAEALRLRDEPVLAAVFEVIETRYAEQISLRDVAAALGLTAGHLTSLVGRRTGRTVQQWIIERRMAAARHLLASTDLTVAALATRVGYRDAGYFGKQFRRAHGVGPAEWRRRPDPDTPRSVGVSQQARHHM